MGLLKISDLKPDVGVAIEQLGEGSVSGLINTEEGYHLLQKGAAVPMQIITLEQSKPQIVKLMLEQLKQHMTKAILKQAQASYPLNLNDTKIEEWYLKLRVN